MYLCADELTVEQVESRFEGAAGVHARFAHRSVRSEPRDRALDYLAGLPAPLERKRGWTPAAQVGQLRPDEVQRLLNLSHRDEDAVRDDVRDFVVETIGAGDGILIGDDTGPGTPSAPVTLSATKQGPSSPIPRQTPRPDPPDAIAVLKRVAEGCVRAGQGRFWGMSGHAAMARLCMWA
ncbi:hypothetical protein ACFYZY_20300, partial [Streptomyces sp. NPDC001744]